MTPMVAHITLIVKKPWSPIALSGHFFYEHTRNPGLFAPPMTCFHSASHPISGRWTNVFPTCFVEFSRRLRVRFLPVACLLCVLYNKIARTVLP